VPFRGDTSALIFQAILDRAPMPPIRINPDIPVGLEQVINKALEKDREIRCQSAAELRADLMRLKRDTESGKAAVLGRVTSKTESRWSRRGIVTSIAGLVVLVVAAVSVGKLYLVHETKRIDSIAVLPLENLSHDPEQEYFADGITEALITSLARIGSLRVISRTSAMRYKAVSKSLPEIGHELNVDAVVEGSVQRSGNRVRITAQLIRAATDQHLWADSYERDLGDVLALQDEVARAIAREIQIKLTLQEQNRFASARPVDPGAYQAYIKGRYYLNRRSAKDVQKAIEYFQQSISKDPSYAVAYAGLADSYYVSSVFMPVAPAEPISKAKAAAKKAVELDDALAEAHVSLALIEVSYDRDWANAATEFKRALELNPGYATAHYLYGYAYLVPQAHFEQGVQEIRRALELDPLSLIINANLGDAYLLARRYDLAIEQGRKTLEIDSNFGVAHSNLGRAYVQKEMYREAISEFQAADASALARLEATRNSAYANTQPLAQLGHAYALSGRRVEALKVLDQLKEVSKGSFVSPFDFAIVFLGLGEKDQAIAWLTKAVEAHVYPVIYLQVDPRFDSLHSDSRYADLLRRIGLQR